MRTTKPPLRRQAMAVAGIAILVVLTGCSSSSDMGEVDRIFVSAAGSWDLNKDSVVTCEEWKTYAGELFDSADGNRDGFVEEAEYTKIVSTDRMFQTVGFSYYDANGDGKISRSEFVDKPNRAFVLLDQTKQCQLSATQVAGARARTEKIFDTKKPKSGDPREDPANTGPGMPQ